MADIRWVHLATAPDELTAELWIAILGNEGITAMIRPSDTASYMGKAGFGTRVQVPEPLLQQARDILGETDEDPAP